MSKLCNQTGHGVIAFVLALAVSVANAQSAKMCIAYMEADAIYNESYRKLAEPPREFRRPVSLYMDSSIHATIHVLE